MGDPISLTELIHRAQRGDAALRLSQQQAIDPEASVFVDEDLIVQGEVLVAQGEAPRGRDAVQRAVTHLEKTAGPKHPAVERARALAFD